MAVAARPPALRTPGLKPLDPAWESYWVRPGGATVIAVRPDDRVTVVDLDGGQPAELTVLDARGRDDGAALGAVADAPATVLRGRCRTAAATASSPRCTRRGLRPEDGARACGSSARTRRRARARRSAPTRAATVVVAAPRRPDRGRRGARLGADRGGPPRRARRARGGRAAAAAGRAAARLPRRQGVARSPTRSAPASTSRSSTCAGASARTSSPSTRTSSSAASSAGSTRRSRAR